MRKLFVAVLGVLFLAFSALPTLAAGDVTKAQGLKNAGKYEEAAAEHPNELCKGVYLVKAAWKLVAYVDKSGDNQIKSNLSEGAKTAALALLDEADKHFANAEKDKVECTGADLETWKAYSANTRACIGGNCNE